MSDALTNVARDLPDWERDRLTAAEACIDEALSMIDRHGFDDDECGMYALLRQLSGHFDAVLTESEGIGFRYERLRRVRDKLDEAFPDPNNDELT